MRTRTTPRLASWRGNGGEINIPKIFMVKQNMDGQMLRKYFKRLALPATVCAVAFIATPASAATLEDIFELSAEGTRIAQTSQAQIDNLSDETQSLLGDYRRILRTIEDLQAYNIQKEREIADQNRQIRTLTSSIERATLIDRQILPLIGRMINVLEDFMANDIPFLLDNRRDRIANLRDVMDNSDVSASEKFRLVFQAYQIENDFGRTIETYNGSIQLGGQDFQGNVLRIGRVGLYFQTADLSTSAHWNSGLGNTGEWEVLDSSFARAISQGIKMADGQVANDLVRLPIIAGE